MPHSHHQICPRPFTRNFEKPDEQIEREKEPDKGPDSSEEAKEQREANEELRKEYKPRKEREVGENHVVDEIAIDTERRMLYFEFQPFAKRRFAGRLEIGWELPS